MLEIDSLSTSLYVKFEPFKVSLVQLTGAMIAKERNAIGVKILSLHFEQKIKPNKTTARDVQNQIPKEGKD